MKEPLCFKVWVQKKNEKKRKETLSTGNFRASSFFLLWLYEIFHRIDARDVIPTNWFRVIALGKIMGIFLCIRVLDILKIFTVDRGKRLFSLFQADHFCQIVFRTNKWSRKHKGSKLFLKFYLWQCLTTAYYFKVETHENTLHIIMATNGYILCLPRSKTF